MRIVASFDPTTETSTTFNAGFSNGAGKIVVYNESNCNLQLSWEAFSTYCPCWTGMLYCITTNQVNINWEIQSTLATTAIPPISQVIVEAYDPNEPIVGTFPAALVRQTNIGNAVNANVSNANALINTGNAPGTNIITVKPSDAASNTWSADNSGNLTINSDNAGTLTTLLQLIAGASPAVKLAAAAVLTEALGSLQVDSNLIVKGTTSLDNGTITTDGSGDISKLKSILFSGAGINVLGYSASGDLLSVTSPDTHWKALSGGIMWFEPSGTQVAKIDTSGFHLNGNFAVDLGSTGFIKGRNGNTIQAVSSFDGTTTGTYNHGFGAAPFWVIPMCKVSGSQTMGFDTVTSTQVHITSGSGLGFRVLCMA